MSKKILFFLIVSSIYFFNLNKSSAMFCDSDKRMEVINDVKQTLEQFYPRCDGVATGVMRYGRPMVVFAGACEWSVEPPIQSVVPFEEYYFTGCDSNIRTKKASAAVDRPQNQCGSVIHTSSQVLGETIPLTGSSFDLNYFSNRVKGRIADYVLNIPISAEVVLSDVTGYNLVIKNDLGTTIHSASFGTSTNQSTTYTSNGLNGAGEEPWATVTYSVEIEEVSPTYGFTYISPTQAGNLKNKKLGIGGWVPSIWYFYDPSSKILYRANGTERAIEAKSLISGMDSFYQVPSEDGSLVYIFDSEGKIIETKLGLTGQVIYSFYYDDSDRLSYINEPFSKTTSFNRNGSGVLTSITAPNGQITTVTHDMNGYLATVTNSNSEVYEMTYQGTGGLLAAFEKPNGAVSTFTYDTQGNLVKDEHSGGKEINLSKVTNSNGSFVITSLTGMNREDIMSVTSDELYSKQENLRADGSKYLSDHFYNESHEYSHNESSVKIRYTPDTVRFDGKTNLIQNIESYSLSQRVVSYYNTITLTDPEDPFSIDTWIKTSEVGYYNYPITSTYNGSTKVTTTSTYLGKTTSTQIDNYQRPISVQQGNLTPVQMTYTDDKLTKITQGTRETNFTYNSTSKLLESVTNALNQTTSYSYNSAERLIKTTLPDLREVNYIYDSRGNLTSITPSSKPAHTMTIGLKEKITSYNPPTLAGVPNVNTTYTYNLDNQLTEVLRPDGTSIEYVYDLTSGRLNKVTIPTGDYLYSYDYLYSNLSLPSKIQAPDLSYIDLLYTYGTLSNVTVYDSSGGYVYMYSANSYENSLIHDESVSGSVYLTTNYTYNEDEDLSQAGDILLSYNVPNGQLVGTVLGNVNDTLSYNTFGELEGYEAKYNATTIYKEDLTRDAIGRVSQKIETLNGITSTFDYSYDAAGRLSQVDKNSSVLATYNYDSNSNRNGGNNGSLITATYDDQDRMTAYKNYTFTYNANGDLNSVTNTSTLQTTTYTYDVFGNLTQVVLPTKTITYEIDPLNRRLGKKDNGVLQKRYAYDLKNRLIAEIDNTGELIRRYVYASKTHVPDYFYDQSNEKYRIISDHLGSVRLVVRESDGNVMQRMEHDEFGRIVADTNPGYQPFGFAGGLYDHETALVRFGARDYMPSAGRWTSKDPIRFDGKDTNLYGYVLQDPINLIDPSGLVFEEQVAEHLSPGQQAAFGATMTYIGTQLARAGVALGFTPVGALAVTGGLGLTYEGGLNVIKAGQRALDPLKNFHGGRNPASVPGEDLQCR